MSKHMTENEAMLKREEPKMSKIKRSEAYETQRVMQRAFNTVLKEFHPEHEGRIEFFEMPFCGYTEDDPVEFGVNWSAIGTVDAATTREFGELLIAAADMIDEYTK